MAAKKQESKERLKGQKIVRKKKVKKNIPVGVVHICSSFNNTIINITDLQGNTISWASAIFDLVYAIPCSLPAKLLQS